MYHIPYMVQDVRLVLEEAFENVNSARKQEYLPEGSEELAEVPPSPSTARASTSADFSMAEKSETELDQGGIRTIT